MLERLALQHSSKESFILKSILRLVNTGVLKLKAEIEKKYCFKPVRPDVFAKKLLQ
jgi:hypothetical protein